MLEYTAWEWVELVSAGAVLATIALSLLVHFTERSQWERWRHDPDLKN